MNRLQEIFNYKEVELAQRMGALSLDDLRLVAADTPSPRGFRKALQTSPHTVALIAEVKKASPSAGLIRADLDPVDLALTYARAGADCLSVLTDEKYFQGSEENLRRCRAAVDLPILRKDFTSHPYHIYEARAIGADAILLIVASLSASQLVEFRELAESLGLDALVEVHTAEEASTAVESGASLIGVNNRDLKTFEVSLATTEAIIPTLPPDVLAVSESGLASLPDVDRAQASGAHAVLIGTAFCASTDVAGSVRSVMGW